ncbi:MAG: glycosyltransferase [Acidobacteria bacterium]|jgi:glycosyltransferase involved in cell wall biosynthesis|nr:MAG: glycosyltransferase [Acidobacteriota bacterium]GIU81227.1 MAG: hypothetical protein KatS3mg006_0291 [Pyrinomonadaceae bacterium]
MPYFSVIIPTYNRAQFIKQTIESVLNQTFTDFEIIVVDDGSTDNTKEVVESIKDERIVYHYKRNEERSVARNTGVKLARGEYVTFLDSDDLLYENHLQTALEMVEKYNQPEWFHLGYEIKNLADGTCKKINFLPEIANSKLIEGNHLSCRGVFIRKDIALKNPFNPKLSSSEDYELWLRLASRYPLYCDNKVTSVLVQHDSRSVTKVNKEKLISQIGILEESLAKDEEFMKVFGKDFPRIKAYNDAYIALHLALAKTDRIDALKHLFKAICHSPKILKQRIFYGAIKRLII